MDEKEYQRQWYLKNREEVLARQKKTNARLRNEKQEFVRALKTSTPCADCQQNFHYSCMDFDHVRATKVGNIARMVGGRASWAAIKEEIAKCDIVCSNCHRIRTWVREYGPIDQRQSQFT